jgi:site-specific DNA-methyltransferase (adenine-specific)
MIGLILDDCMNIMQRYPDNHFDLAIVDPPYGIDIAEWDKKEMKPNKKYFNELFRVSQNQIIWGGNYFELPHSEGWLCWDKTFKYNQKLNVGEFELAWTSFDKKHKFIRYTSCGNFQGWNNPRADYTKQKSFHPTSKPIPIYEWLLKNYAEKGQKILDTHLGSVSIAVACHYFGVDLVGIEIDEEYYNKAKERIDSLTKQSTLF